MRRLLNAADDWLFYHSPGRIPALLNRVEHLERRVRGVEQLESRMVAMEAVLDRIGPVSTDEREIRELVRKVYAAGGEGREALDWMFGLTGEKLAVVLQRAAASDADRTLSDAETVADLRPADAEGQL